MRRIILTTAAAVLAFGVGSATAAEKIEFPPQDWSFEGIFGTYDKAAMKRGYQIYSEVCSICHGLKFIYYRNLADLGFSADEIKEIAAYYEVPAGPNEDGETTDEDGYPLVRPALPSDRLVEPFPNEQAARAANNGALPPDLSLIVDARKGGADYIHALLMGFKDEPPEGFELQGDLYYNEYFLGHQIAMAQPLYDESVEYEDGTKATLDQHARDLTTFLAWTSEPNMEERKGMGIWVMFYMILLTALLYALKRRIWADVH